MIVLNVIICFIFVTLWAFSRKYEKELMDGLDEKQYKLKKLFPLGLFCLDKLSNLQFVNKKKRMSSKLDEPLKALFVGEQLECVKRLYICNKFSIVLLLVFISNILSLGSNVKSIYDNQLLEGKYIKRPDYNQGSKSVSLDVLISKDEFIVLEDEIQLEVNEKRYDKEELDKKFAYAKEYIDATILDHNKAADEVITDLKLVTVIPKTGLVVKWVVGNPDLINKEGQVYNQDITEGVLTWVTAVITYYEKQEEYTRYIKILPKDYTATELAKKKLWEVLNSMAEESQTEEVLTLPSTMEEQNVSWAEKKQESGIIFLLFGIIIAVLIYGAIDYDLVGKVDKRNREMLLDYPEIINKFTLLVGAGMSLSNAWSKIAQDYKEKGTRKRYAYEEMMITYGELRIGISEITAYERFGRRVKLIPYLRFSSLIAQNVKKGSVGLLRYLELEAAEAFEERKDLAKRMGEEAGTKLLIPMMLMLLIVLAIIMIPAFLSFGT